MFCLPVPQSPVTEHGGTCIVAHCAVVWTVCVGALEAPDPLLFWTCGAPDGPSERVNDGSPRTKLTAQ